MFPAPNRPEFEGVAEVWRRPQSKIYYSVVVRAFQIRIRGTIFAVFSKIALVTMRIDRALMVAATAAVGSTRSSPSRSCRRS